MVVMLSLKTLGFRRCFDRWAFGVLSRQGHHDGLHLPKKHSGFRRRGCEKRLMHMVWHLQHPQKDCVAQAYDAANPTEAPCENF